MPGRSEHEHVIPPNNDYPLAFFPEQSNHKRKHANLLDQWNRRPRNVDRVRPLQPGPARRWWWGNRRWHRGSSWRIGGGRTRRWNRSLDRWRGGGGRRGANDTVATIRTFYRLWLPIIPLLAQSVLNCRLSSFHSVDQRMNCTLCRRGVLYISSGNTPSVGHPANVCLV